CRRCPQASTISYRAFISKQILEEESDKSQKSHYPHDSTGISTSVMLPNLLTATPVPVRQPRRHECKTLPLSGLARPSTGHTSPQTASSSIRCHSHPCQCSTRAATTPHRRHPRG